jgi:hypothetical protein
VDFQTFIVSVVTSGVASTIIGFWLNAGKSRTEFLRDKLEQAFVAERRFSNLIGGYIWMPYMLFLTGKGPFPDLANIEKAPEGTDRPRETFEMLSSLYFPEFLPAWVELANALKEFNRVQFSINREDGTGHRAGELAKALDGRMKVFQQKQKALEETLILRARQLTPRSWWYRVTRRVPSVIWTLEDPN